MNPVRRIWTGAALQVDLRGNKDAAVSMVRDARIHAGYLFDTLPKEGTNFREFTWNYNNGSTVKVFVCRTPQGEWAKAQIWAPGGSSQKITFYLEHGFIKDEEFIYATEKILEVIGQLGVVFAPVEVSDNPGMPPTYINTLPDYINGDWYKIRPLLAQRKSGPNKEIYCVPLRRDFYDFYASGGPYYAPDGVPYVAETAYDYLRGEDFWVYPRGQIFPYDLSRPHLYSGLMRLLAQAKLGVGIPFWKFYNEDMRVAIPALANTETVYGYGRITAPIRNTNIGCIRSPTNEYWIIVVGLHKDKWQIETSRTGIHACKLIPPAWGGFLQEVAKNDAYPREIRELADAWILAHSTVVANSSVTILNAESYMFALLYGVEDVFSASISTTYSHTASGWGLCWTKQHRGAPDEYTPAARVTMFPDGQLPGGPGRTTVLNFSWSDTGVPEVNVTVEHEGESGYIASWYGEDGGVYTLTSERFYGSEFDDPRYYTYTRYLVNGVSIVPDPYKGTPGTTFTEIDSIVEQTMSPGILVATYSRIQIVPYEFPVLLEKHRFIYHNEQSLAFTGVQSTALNSPDISFTWDVNDSLLDMNNFMIAHNPMYGSTNYPVRPSGVTGMWDYIIESYGGQLLSNGYGMNPNNYILDNRHCFVGAA